MNLKKSKKATAFVMAGMMLCSGTNVLAVRAEQPVPYGMEVRAAERYESSLPVVYIDTENHAPIVSKDYYLNGTIEMQGNDRFNSDTTTLYTGALEIKGRGNSTWGMPKKPYKLKLDKKTDIFGYGKSKH